MPLHLGSLPRILQPSDDIFVSRPSRHRVDVASRRRLYEFHRAKVSKKRRSDNAAFSFFFFVFSTIVFFCSLSLFAEHFHRARIYARSLYASLESYKCTYYTVKTNPLFSGKIFCFAYRMTSTRSILDQRWRRTRMILLLLPFFR